LGDDREEFREPGKTGKILASIQKDEGPGPGNYPEELQVVH